MEKFENLTLEQAAKIKTDLLSKGYQETQSIEQVEAGKLSAVACVSVKGNKKSAIFSIITFERKVNGEIKKLLFEAVDVNAKHLSSGKVYNNLKVKAVDELKDKLSTPANLSKEILLSCEPYVDSANRQRTIVKFDSIAV